MPIRLDIQRLMYFGDIIATSKGIKISTEYEDIYLKFNDTETTEEFIYLIKVVTPEGIEKGEK